MKIERAESKFEPVVITLESQREIDALGDIIALAANHTPDVVHGTVEWAVKEFYLSLHNSLEHFVTDDCNLVYLDTPSTLISFK